MSSLGDLRRSVLFFLSVAIGLTSLSTVGLASAQAATCSLSNHCYGIARHTSPSVEGSQITSQTNCMTVPTPTTDFITNEMWVTDGTYWTEAGATIGVHNGGGYNTALTYYWADNRPGTGGYHEHYFAGPVGFNSPVLIKILESTNGSGTWNVTVGANSGTSTSNILGPTTYADAGIEATTATGHVYAQDTSMSYYGTARTSTGTWATSTLLTQAGATVAWVSTNHSLNAALGAAC